MFFFFFNLKWSLCAKSLAFYNTVEMYEKQYKSYSYWADPEYGCLFCRWWACQRAGRRGHRVSERRSQTARLSHCLCVSVRVSSTCAAVETSAPSPGQSCRSVGRADRAPGPTPGRVFGLGHAGWHRSGPTAWSVSREKPLSKSWKVLFCVLEWRKWRKASKKHICRICAFFFFFYKKVCICRVLLSISVSFLCCVLHCTKQHQSHYWWILN